MVQGRGSANSSAKANFAFADEWFKVGGRQIRPKANFAFADEWFKVVGRQIRRQRQILPLPTNGSRSGVGKFVGKGKFCLCRRMVQGRGSANSSAKANFAFADEWFQAKGSREGRGSA